MHYRRAKEKGGMYFFTLVTYKRAKILCDPENVRLLRESFKKIMEKHPFKIDSIVLLPDHLHCIWILPEFESDYSKRWRLIKGFFTKNCNEKYKEQNVSISRKVKTEKAVWQRRFWEHRIRDDKDYHHHCDYIHYNPVKHGLVKFPGDWDYSSFQRFVEKGKYSQDWCASEKAFDKFDAGE